MQQKKLANNVAYLSVMLFLSFRRLDKMELQRISS